MSYTTADDAATIAVVHGIKPLPSKTNAARGSPPPFDTITAAKQGAQSTQRAAKTHIAPQFTQLSLMMPHSSTMPQCCACTQVCSQHSNHLAGAGHINRLPDVILCHGLFGIFIRIVLDVTGRKQACITIRSKVAILLLVQS